MQLTIWMCSWVYCKRRCTYIYTWYLSCFDRVTDRINFLFPFLVRKKFTHHSLWFSAIDIFFHVNFRFPWNLILLLLLIFHFNNKINLSSVFLSRSNCRRESIFFSQFTLCFYLKLPRLLWLLLLFFRVRVIWIFTHANEPTNIQFKQVMKTESLCFFVHIRIYCVAH